MVLKTHGFNAKISFEINAPSPEILAKMYQNLAFQAKCPKFLPFFGNISGLGAYFSKSIFAMKPWVSFRTFLWLFQFLGNFLQFFFAVKQNRKKIKPVLYQWFASDILSQFE